MFTWISTEKSCHTALRAVKTVFTGVKWFVEGDIEGFFDNIDHAVLTNILRKRISDERFINLIQKFLKAGYMENWVYHKTYSGTPQGGIISPILSNIYLNELDKYVMELKKRTDKGDKRRRNPEYRSVSGKLYRMRKNLKENWGALNETEREKHKGKETA